MFFMTRSPQAHSEPLDGFSILYSPRAVLRGTASIFAVGTTTKSQRLGFAFFIEAIDFAGSLFFFLAAGGAEERLNQVEAFVG